jgi:octanoyl-[GcvH]:protein N-octanoyltransferase
MPQRTIRLVRAGFPDDMALDTAVSRVLLDEASAGGVETLRLSVPGRAVAFGKHDVAMPGFADAVAAARLAGYPAIIRMAGGRAAVFHEGTVAMSWTIPDEDPVAGIRHRFAAASRLVVDALADLGIVAEVGELPGEYCPGEFSVHVGSVKVAGLGQRLTRSAAHIGGVVVVRDADAVRKTLIPVYDALGLEWEPTTAGALDGAAPGLEHRDVVGAIVRRLAGDADVVPASLAPEVVESARAVASEFVVG